MFVGRWLGYLALLAALLAAVRDGIVYLISQQFAFITLGEIWAEHHLASLNQVQAGIQRNIHPGLWDWGMQPVLTAPAVVVLLILGLILALVFRKRPKRRRVFGVDRGRRNSLML